MFGYLCSLILSQSIGNKCLVFFRTAGEAWELNEASQSVYVCLGLAFLLTRLSVDGVVGQEYDGRDSRLSRAWEGRDGRREPAMAAITADTSPRFGWKSSLATLDHGIFPLSGLPLKLNVSDLCTVCMTNNDVHVPV